MERKVGKEHEEESKKREEVGNDNSLACMFAKQQAARDLNKVWLALSTMHSFKRGKRNGLDEAAQAKTVRKRHT